MSSTTLLTINPVTDFWETRANQVLSHFNFSYPDEIDMWEICRRYGIDIMPLEHDFYDGEITDDMKAFSISQGINARGVIYLLPSLNTIEKKILLAEEFCHLHAHYMNQLSADQYQINKCEHQAKKMAAYLLMPSRFLLDLLKVDYYDQAVLVSELADHFLVTEEFAHYRLELLFKHRVDLVANIRGEVGSLQLFE